MRILPYVRLLLRLFLKVRNWPVYFRNRYGFVRDGLVSYRLRCGVTVVGRPFKTDGTALNDVWLDESYDPNRFGIPFDWSACGTVIDIGGNIGTFTLWAAHKAPNARIIAVEPEPGNADMFRKNVAVNALGKRVTLLQVGIAKEAGTANLHFYEKNSGGHSLFKFTEQSHPVPVELITLQSVFDRHGLAGCDYLKMDCEGGEYDGLYGLKPEILANIPFIAVEYHHFSQDPRHTPEELRRFLEQHGFTVTEPKKSIFFAQKRPTV